MRPTGQELEAWKHVCQQRAAHQPVCATCGRPCYPPYPASNFWVSSWRCGHCGGETIQSILFTDPCPIDWLAVITELEESRKPAADEPPRPASEPHRPRCKGSCGDAECEKAEQQWSRWRAGALEQVVRDLMFTGALIPVHWANPEAERLCGAFVEATDRASLLLKSERMPCKQENSESLPRLAGGPG